MNGFLVMVRCGIDDIPVRFCETEDEALEAAKTLKLAEVETVKSVLGLDTSIYVGVTSIWFVDGKPIGARMVRDFDDEPDCEFPS